jgi:hypothetical protein
MFYPDCLSLLWVIFTRCYLNNYFCSFLFVLFTMQLSGLSVLRQYLTLCEYIAHVYFIQAAT